MPAPTPNRDADAFRVQVRIPIFTEAPRAAVMLRSALGRDEQSIVREWEVRVVRRIGVEVSAFVPIEERSLREWGSLWVVTRVATLVQFEIALMPYVYGVKGADTSVIGKQWVRWAKIDEAAREVEGS